MKKVTRVICVMAFCLVAMMEMSNVSRADEVQYTDNAIPKMTSDTSPSGIASASSAWSKPNEGSFPAYNAFNYDGYKSYDGWVSASGYPTCWLSYEFDSMKKITRYTLISRNTYEGITDLPKDWTFEAWNNETGKWDILDSRKNVIDWKLGVKKEFTFSNNKAYSKYRINITANCGFASYTAIGEMEMMEAKPTPIYEGNSAILEIAMTNGTIKEYSLTNTELESFLIWYDNRSDGIGKSYYRIPKKSNVKPFLSRKEYLSFDKIYSFEVKDYNE